MKYVIKQNLMIPLIISALLIACSSNKELIPNSGTIEGKIYLMGNEPFTKLGLNTKDGTVYILKADESIESYLNKIQGKVVVIKYKGIEHSPDGIILTVLEVQSPTEIK